ncbi:MAG: glycosyltransferase family 4 protein [Candidatus Woesearchaeota archaeon]
MKILFILEHYHPHTGGVEVLFKNICEGMAKKGHVVEVVTTRLENTKKQETIDGVKITRINTPPFMRRYWFTFLAIPYVTKNAGKYDILHTTTYNGAFPAKVASMASKTPSIITVHEIIGKDWGTLGGLGFFSAKIHQFLEWLIVKLNFDKYICVSNSTKKNLLEYRVPKDKADVIYNGVSYDIFDGKKYLSEAKDIRRELERLSGKKRRFIYLFYGRPGISKGFEYVLNAVSGISKKIPDPLFVAILGKRPEKRRRMFEEMIEKHPYKDDILLIDPVEYKELPHYLKSADCIVVPSLTEGFGYCVAESTALGVPVVATDTTSIPEVISGKFKMVRPKSSFRIAKAVVDVYHGRYEKTPLKRFGWDGCVKGYENLYDEMIKCSEK